MKADSSPAERYVARQLSPRAEVNRLRQDIIAIDAVLERAEMEVKRIRRIRDSLVARFESFSEEKSNAN